MREDMKWKRFWTLEVLWEFKYKYYWTRRIVYEYVKCDCWKKYYTRRDHLRWWRINNCWCKKIERFKSIWLQWTHYMDWTRICNIYRWLTQRCTNINNSRYKNYGWRWIKCLWKNFEEKWNIFKEEIIKQNIL